MCMAIMNSVVYNFVLWAVTQLIGEDSSAGIIYVILLEYTPCAPDSVRGET